MAESNMVLHTENSNSESSTRMDHEAFNADICCLEFQLTSSVAEPREKRKLLYTLKISDVDRYQPQNQYSGSKIFEWVNQRTQQLKFAFKFKYIKSDIIFEVMSIVDTSQQKKKYYDDVLPRDLLYRAQFNFEDVIQKKNTPLKPNVVEFTNDASNRVQLILREFKVTQKTLVSFCLQIPPLQLNNTESIFKNSRLMLDEIVDSGDSDWVNLNDLQDSSNNSQSGRDSILKSN